MNRFLPLLLACAAPAFADDLDTRATAIFSAAFAEPCVGAFLEDGNLIDPPTRFEMVSASSYGEPEPMTFWQFRCNIGAYNVQSVILANNDYYGIHAVSLSLPDMKITYKDPDNEESAVEEVKVVGWSASTFVTNAEFDVEKAQVTATSYWRGIGDASHSAVWSLVDGEFRLVRFDVDPSYDGVVNQQPVANFQ